MTDGEFITNLEETIKYPWSGLMTLRLWKLCRYSDPGPTVRDMYSKDESRRRAHINRAKGIIRQQVIERLDT